MLKITIHDSALECRFHLEGKLSGAWVNELRLSWRTALSTTAGRTATVDLRDVDFIDDEGQVLLKEMHGEGAKFQAVTPMMRALVEQVTGVPLPRAVPAAAPRSHRFPRLPHLVSLLTAMLAMLAAAAAANGAPPADAEATLDRYLAASGADAPDRAVELSIEASLPSMNRSAVMRALEFVPSHGRALFRTGSAKGDGMVRRQVIARYLAAEAEARAGDPGLIALSRANYQFRYLRTAGYDDRAAYIFEVRPRFRRASLYRGELWLDSASAAPLRQWGVTAKSPSLFIRRIRFMRDYDLTTGAPRLLAVNVESRIAGRADLTIRYRPVASGDGAIARFECASFEETPEAETAPGPGRSDAPNRSDRGLDACAL